MRALISVFLLISIFSITIAAAQLMINNVDAAAKCRAVGGQMHNGSCVSVE